MKFFVVVLACFAALGPVTTTGQITVSPWEIHEGTEGIVDFENNFNGDPRAYEKKNIPDVNHSGWKPAEKDANGNVFINRSSSVICRKQLDFTYFQTLVSIPANTPVQSFTVSYDHADDGARIYFFNAKSPEGMFDAKADLVINNGNTSGVVNLRDKVVTGVNRIVIVQFDDCADKNTLSGIHVKVNGKEVAPQEVRDESGNVYGTVTIGTQVWLSHELKTTAVSCSEEKLQFTDGSKRGPNVPFYDGTPRYAYYDNRKEDNLGIIYNYSAIEACDICPEGFRVPTKADWEKLATSVGGMANKEAGKKLLPGGSSGFNGGLSGRIDSYGSGLKKSNGFWWAIDIDENNKMKAYTFELMSDGTIKLIPQDKRVGNYVRCIAKPKPLPLPVKFKVLAFSVHEGKTGDHDKYWFGLPANDTRGSILSEKNLVDGAKWMEIEKVNAGKDIYAFKVTNAGTDMYLIARDNLEVYVDKATANNLPDGAKFRANAPLTSTPGAKERNFLSFESVKFPGHYLRHSNYIMFVHPPDGSGLFKEDASWLIEKM